MFKVAALYKFHSIENPLSVRHMLKSNLDNNLVTGTILIGKEGLNGTISASIKDMKKAISIIKSIKGFDDINIKYSKSKIKPFIRLKVKTKEEIVTIGDKKLDPSINSGIYVEPKDWNSFIAKDDVLLIDTRNNYEYSIGTFKNSINPRTNNFREFPNWVKNQKFSNKDKKTKKVAMFCTGGIRCEKATSYMKKEGFKNVFHLKGGVLKYFEDITTDQSKWIGECFVFDDRVSLDHNLDEGSYDMCHGCRMPITKQDKESKYFIKGVSCPACFASKTDEQKSRYMSRQKQIDLAKSRNESHIGPK
ncbi:rhodanese-related sulfurtransferase [SAR86 cluster bacterium]|nr:rhodanese-related sulfurtransferase [SAR86 cluster bacterium]|tara:strand:- start:165 stop:1079 length:915 start_codon:yes stop_codon:yes gene_type:complete